jgi:hypothetical protein
LAAVGAWVGSPSWRFASTAKVFIGIYTFAVVSIP